MHRTMAFLLVLAAAGLFGIAAQGKGKGMDATMAATAHLWAQYAVRPEIAPRFFTAQDPRRSLLLGLAGQGNAAADGRWQRRVPVEAGKWYRLTTSYRAKGVRTPARSLLARLIWQDEAGQQIEQAEYPMPALHPDADGWQALSGIYMAPPSAMQALLELHLRWAPQGEVLWRPAELHESAPPAPRKVRLAAANHRPKEGASPRANLEQFLPLLEEAGRRKADIVCLPEGTTVCGLSQTYVDVAEPVPGPSTRWLGEQAVQHHCWLIAGIYEREGKVVYNTSVLLDRQGRLAGKYRKVCLPREEIDAGITPGKDYPVFDTDFGRIGMMICWDLSYPEVARALSARGAEIIFLPIWGGNETLAQARAIENQVYLVASGYDFPTCILDREGKTLARSTKDSELVVTEVDLAQRTLWPWLGDWRSRVWREGPAVGSSEVAK